MMGGLAGSVGKLFGGLTAPGFPAEALPGNLGLPEKSSVNGVVAVAGGKNRNSEIVDKTKYDQEFAKAENYNKAFADLLNQQPQLNGEERKQVYDYYSDKFMADKSFAAENPKMNLGKLTDYSSTLSQLTPDQFKAQQTQQAAAPQTQAPAAPQTVGPTQAQPEATPTVATPGGNIAGATTTNSATAPEKSSGRRGRMATLLTGLGGAVERFGL